MPNTNFQTIHQMGSAISNVVKQASGRDPVQNIDMDFVTVAQNKTIGEMTISGNPASFHTSNAVPIQRLLIGMNPIQSGSGDPSPSNVRPITGWTGVTVTRSKDKLFTITDESVVQGSLNSSSGGNVSSNYRIRTDYIKVEPDTTYTVYANIPYLYIYEYSTDSASGFIQNSGSWERPPKTFTTTETTEYIKLLFAKSTSASGVEITPEDLTYCDVLEDAVSVRIPVNFPDPPGTVYKGTLDLISGVLTVTHLMQTFTGAESEDWLNTYESNGFRISSRGMKVALLNTGLCNWLPVLSEVGNAMGVALGMNDSDIYVRHITDNLEIADLTEWRAYLAQHPLEVFYPLEPAQYYQVTPQDLNTLAGDNVIFTDGDTLEVMYYQYGEV